MGSDGIFLTADFVTMGRRGGGRRRLVRKMGSERSRSGRGGAKAGERVAGGNGRGQRARTLRAVFIGLGFLVAAAAVLIGTRSGVDGRTRAEADVVAGEKVAVEQRGTERTARAKGEVDGAAVKGREAAGARAVAAFAKWVEDWRAVDEGRRAEWVGEGVALAERRRVWMKALIVNEPTRALREAMAADVRATLPRDVQARVEERVEVRGDFLVKVACGAGAAGGHWRGYGVSVAGREWRAYPVEAAVGAGREEVSQVGALVHGVALDGEMAVAEVQADTVAAVAEPSWVFGVKRTLFLRIDFADAAGPVSHDATITAATAAVSDFYAAMAAGRTTFTATILPGVLRAAKSRAAYGATGVIGTTELGNEALALARAYDRANGGTGLYDPDRADRWVVIANGVPGFFSGLANVGTKGIWLNTFSPDSATLRLDLAHELGHNQGLNHSNRWQPTGTSPLTPGRHVEYGDVFDVMGNSSSFPSGHFNAQQKFFIGYLEAGAVAQADRTATYRIFRHDHREAAGVRAVVIPSLADRDYWLEYRRDAVWAELRTNPGVLLHWGRAPAYAGGTGKYLLDATTTTPDDAADGQLRVGVDFTDAIAGVTVRPLAVGGVAPNDYIDVRIEFPTGVNPAASATAVPVVTRAPVIAGVTADGGVQLAVEATGGGLIYQWQKNGAAIAGATTATLTLPVTTVATWGGGYRVTISNALGSVGSAELVLGGSQLTNLAVRTTVGTAERTLIAGFALRGAGTKQLLVRGIGPALAGFGIVGASADTRLDVFSAGGVSVAENDDWAVPAGGGNAAAVAVATAVRGAFPLGSTAKDAALVATLPSGAWSAHVTAAGGGVGLLELYDEPVLSASPTLRLVNLSARAEVGAGENVLIAGFTIAGNLPRRMLVRAVGPGLGAFGVPGVLGDPKLELFRDGVRVAENDNWDAPLAPTAAAAGAFALASGSRDAALLVTLLPGGYTAQVSGVGGVTGVALVEIYEVP